MTRKGIITVCANALRTEIRVIFPYSAETKKLAVETLGCEAVYIGVYPNKKFDHWRLPITPEHEKKLRAVLSDERFEIEESALSMLEVSREWQEQNLRIADENIESENEKAKNEFLISNGVEYVLRNMRGVIVNHYSNLIRVGIAIKAIEKAESLPVLIISTVENKYNWAAFLQSIPNLKGTVRIISGNRIPDNEPLSEYTIINYDILPKHEKYINSLEWKAVIFDSAISNLHIPKRQRTQAALSIAKNINHKIALCEMDPLNQHSDLISILEIIGRLEEFGGRWEFANRFCGAIKDHLGNWDLSQNLEREQLLKQLKKICYIRK